MPSVQIDQIDLVGAIGKHLQKRHGITNVLQREWNAMIRAANMICDEFAKPEVKATAGMGLKAWLKSDDTGLSSLFMAQTLVRMQRGWAGVRYGDGEYHYPLDPDDLHRCLMLLDAVPEFRPAIGEMAKTGPEWAKLVEHWTELESTLREELPSGSAPKTYAMMTALLKGQSDESAIDSEQRLA